MIKRIGHITILANNQDEALEFYVKKLGFVKREEPSSEKVCVGSLLHQKAKGV